MTASQALSAPGTANAVRADVDRGLRIVAELTQLEDELDEIEARLAAAGLEGDQVELNDPDREGRQYLAQGSERIVPVVFTADLLVGQFQADSDVQHRIWEALPVTRLDHYRTFFRSVRIFKSSFESGKAFRAKAAELLGDAAPAFISACLQRDKDGIPKSKVKIDWHRAEALARNATHSVAGGDQKSTGEAAS